MAAPFGGHPTLADYIDRVRSQHGCRARSGVLSDDNGQVLTTTQIIGPTKKWVTLVGTRHDERLVPTMVGYLDRRLGLVSGFPALDDPDQSD